MSDKKSKKQYGYQPRNETKKSNVEKGYQPRETSQNIKPLKGGTGETQKK